MNIIGICNRLGPSCDPGKGRVVNESGWPLTSNLPVPNRQSVTIVRHILPANRTWSAETRRSHIIPLISAFVGNCEYMCGVASLLHICFIFNLIFLFLMTYYVTAFVTLGLRLKWDITSYFVWKKGGMKLFRGSSGWPCDKIRYIHLEYSKSRIVTF